MPTNKNALLRYKVLDRCFKNKFKKCTLDDLHNEVLKALKEEKGENATISKRMIQRDIQFMRSSTGYQAPIDTIREGKKVYYRYSDPSFSIFDQPLTKDELSIVKQIYALIAPVEGRFEYRYLKEILLNLDKSLATEIDDSLKIISYEENPLLKNSKYLGQLYMAILSKQTLEILYKPFVEEAKTLIFHPYFLKQFNNRWFLFGYDEASKKQGIYPVNLALDRIQSITHSNVPYVENRDIDFAKFFEHLIGVTKPAGVNVKKISFAVTEQLKPYLETKPIHHSQTKFRKYGDMYRSSIHVIPNYEMYALFLSFGKDFKVIAPEREKQEMKNIITTLYNLYNE